MVALILRDSLSSDRENILNALIKIQGVRAAHPNLLLNLYEIQICCDAAIAKILRLNTKMNLVIKRKQRELQLSKSMKNHAYKTLVASENISEPPGVYVCM